MTEHRRVPNQPDTTDPGTGTGRIPPHDLDAERALIGAMLLTPTAITTALEHLDPADLYSTNHGHIYHAITHIHAAGNPVDTVTVADELARRDLLEHIGGPTTLINIQAATPAAGNATTYAHIIHRHAARRRTITAATDLADQAYDAHTDPADLLHTAARHLTELAETAPDTHTTTWAPLDLDNLDDTPAPTLLTRNDGQATLYPGRVNALWGPSESGKSWLALAAVHETMTHGDTAIYIDFEDTPSGVIHRLKALGATDQQIRDQFAYIHPEDPLDDRNRAHLNTTIERLDPALIVVDGVTEAMNLHGLELNSNDDAATFLRTLPRPLAATGAAVLLIDHVTHATETRNRAIGAQHKRAGIDGTALLVEVRTPMGRDRTGTATIAVAKDRLGHVRAACHNGKTFGTLTLTAENQLTIAPPDRATADWEGPTDCMAAIAHLLEDHSDGLHRTGITEALRAAGKSYRNTTIGTALEILVNDGRVMKLKSGRSHLYYSHDADQAALDLLDGAP